MKLDFSFSLPDGNDHLRLSVTGFDASVEYQTSKGLDFNAAMTNLTYGTDKHTMSVSGLHLSPGEYVIDSIALNDTDSKVNVTMEQCYYIGTFFASKMTGTVGGTDVSTISFTKEQTGDYYIGDFYFSISEGIKAYKNGEEKNPPKDAITLTVPHVGLTFTGSGKEWSIPIGTTVKFDDYYDVLDQFDLGLVAHTGDSYVMTLASVKASVAQPITVDEKGVVEVKGGGVVLTKEALDKITVDTITIKTGGDITVVISLDALKRLQSGTDKTVLAFEAFDATKDNIGGAYDRMSDADKAKAAAGRIVTVDVGKSTATDKLGETKITIPFDIGTLDPNKLTAYFIDGDSLEKVSAATYSDGYVTFTTTHFSSFLICEELDNPPTHSKLNMAIIIIAIAVILAVILIMTAVVMRDKKAAA